MVSFILSRFRRKKKPSLLTIDSIPFEECHPKVVRIWHWKKMRKILKMQSKDILG